MSIRIVLADDHRMFREGLRAVLEGHAGIEVAGEAEDGRTAVRLARDMNPDVVVMDVSMPDLNGIEASRKITVDLPKVKVLCLSMHSESRFVTAMLGAGAAGYLLKDCAAEELVRAIRAVVSGNIYLSPAIAGEVVKYCIDSGSHASGSAFSLLTGREREVLQLIAEGLNTKEIGQRLHVSEKTVASHRAHLMTKLQMRSVADLTKYAVREGLTAS